MAAKYDAEVIALASMPDAVHLLCQVDPQFGIPRLVKNIQGVSSHSLRQEFSTLCSRLPALWTNSYFHLDRGGAPLAAIPPYVENQKDV
jgi:putative transposase